MKIKLHILPSVTMSSVKSVCMHPSRTFVYCGLASGSIQCWDYSGGHKVVDMVGHCGPVRALHCHESMHLMVSCSDDKRVVVWDLVDHKIKFSLRGHSDYVRCVKFHPVHPWLVTGSDDCTIKIWNWQSRSLVYTVSGHQHWVTSIVLHDTKDIMVSASVDGTVRLWDYSSLRNRTCNIGKHSDLSSLFGLVEVVCLHIWEGFTGKVGWVVIHSRDDLIAVGDGRVVRMYNVMNYKEVGNLHGHEKDITGCAFLARSLVTVSRDKKTKVWNYESGVCRTTHNTEHGWDGVVGYRTRGHLVAWGDKGVVVFKLWKERPVMAVHMHHLYYVKDGAIRHVNLDKNKDKVVVNLDGSRESQMVSMEYNPSEHGLLINSLLKGNHTYQLFFIVEASNSKPKIKKSPGSCSVWTSHNRFALLDSSSQLVVKNLDNQNVNFGGFSTGFLLRKSEPESVHKIPICDKLFPGGQPGHILMRDGELFTLYDVVKKRRVSSAKFVSAKHIIWSSDKSLLTIFSKNNLWMCDKRLKVLQEAKTRSPVKSVSWCTNSTILYTTENQLRYMLVSGDSGVVATIQEPLYIAMVRQEEVICLNRKSDIKLLKIDSTEFRLKAAVLEGNEVEMMGLIQSGKVMGQSMLQFLRSAGRPDLALSFIRDPLSRFCLAIESNNLSAAMDAAKTLDTGEVWEKMANFALINGELSMAEASYQKGRAYTKLLFLYLITGQNLKLTKLASILKVRGDFSGMYQIHLLTGNKEQAVNLLEDSGNMELAKLMRSQESCSLKPAEALCNGGLNWPKIVDVEENNREIGDKEILVENYRDALKEGFNAGEYIIDDNSESCDNVSDPSNKEVLTGKISTVSPGLTFDLKEMIEKLYNDHGVVNFKPMKKILIGVCAVTPCLTSVPSTPPLYLSPCVLTHQLDFLMIKAHNQTTAGKFSSAVEMYRTIMLTAILSKEDQGRLVKLCAEYIITLTMEMERKKCGKSSPMEKIRQCQLAIFATKYPILPVHQILLLRSAISICMKVGNPRSAMALSRELLTLSPSSEVSRFARSVILNHSQSQDTFPMEEIVNSIPVICGGDFIVLDGEVTTCPLCCVQFGRAYSGHLCPVDRVARIRKM